MDFLVILQHPVLATIASEDAAVVGLHHNHVGLTVQSRLPTAAPVLAYRDVFLLGIALRSKQLADKSRFVTDCCGERMI
jgi:hypothetical protein